MVREFFDETKCSILYVDLEPYLGAHPWEEFNKMLWGAYRILGRLDEIPRDQRHAPRTYPPAIVTGQFHFGAYYAQASDHSWGPEHPLSEDERLARAREGEAMIGEVIRTIDPSGPRGEDAGARRVPVEGRTAPGPRPVCPEEAAVPCAD